MTGDHLARTEEKMRVPIAQSQPMDSIIDLLINHQLEIGLRIPAQILYGLNCD